MPNHPIEELTWKEAQPLVRRVDKKLADLIDKINPDKSYKLFKATYAFGDLVVKDGVVQIPTDNGLVSLTDPGLPKKIKDKLTYSPIPLLLTLKNANEVFIDTGSRIVPLNLFHAGSLLGLFESTDYMFGRKSEPKWSVSAGARSIFMLPKINESTGFKRLRARYGLASSARLLYTSDHWHIFTAIANHENFTQAWQNEILFFSKEWLAENKTTPEWTAFHRYLMQTAWQQAQFAIGKLDLSLTWEAFSDAIASRRLKPSPYLADQVKHIMLIAANKWPGFRPADDSQQAAPTLGLQAAFVETYQLKQHLPTLMHPSLAGTNHPVYYSLTYPTLLEGAPYNKSSSTIMFDLRDIKLLLEILISSSRTNKKFENSVMKQAAFDYFHVEVDKFQEIKSSVLIPETDPSFLNIQANYKDLTFCSTSPFWRGCIKIMLKDDES